MNVSGGYVFYQQTEGISRVGNKLYFVAKRFQQLFILDLDGGTYEETSTERGAFNRQPDQIQFILSIPSLK